MFLTSRIGKDLSNLINNYLNNYDRFIISYMCKYTYLQHQNKPAHPTKYQKLVKYVIRNNYINLLKYLVDICGYFIDPEYFLHSFSNIEIVNYFLEKNIFDRPYGFYINMCGKDLYKSKCIEIAIVYGNIDVVKLLYSKGCVPLMESYYDVGHIYRKQNKTKNQTEICEYILSINKNSAGNQEILSININNLEFVKWFIVEKKYPVNNKNFRLLIQTHTKEKIQFLKTLKHRSNIDDTGVEF